MITRPSVLVTGATGNQGGALTRLLLATGHQVRALTRNPAGEVAARLRTLGAKVTAGDFDDPASLRAAAHGVDAVFAMGTPFQAGGTWAEARQGQAIVQAAQAAHVGHLRRGRLSGPHRHRPQGHGQPA
jgi:uncharacterized protein YbjT (DUF2867 family)